MNEIEGLAHTPVRHELDAELAAIESERVERVVVPEPEEIRLERVRGMGNEELLDVLTRTEGDEEESDSVKQSGLGEPRHAVA